MYLYYWGATICSATSEWMMSSVKSGRVRLFMYVLTCVYQYQSRMFYVLGTLSPYWPDSIHDSSSASFKKYLKTMFYQETAQWILLLFIGEVFLLISKLNIDFCCRFLITRFCSLQQLVTLVIPQTVYNQFFVVTCNATISFFWILLIVHVHVVRY